MYGRKESSRVSLRPNPLILEDAELISSEKQPMKNVLRRLWNEEKGQDLLEYALLIVLLCLAAIGSIGGLATAISNTFNNAASNLNT